MSVEIVERKTERGARYYYVVENGKRLAQCKKRADARRVMHGLETLAKKEAAFNLQEALTRDTKSREEAQAQMRGERETPRASGIVIAEAGEMPPSRPSGWGAT